MKGTHPADPRGLIEEAYRIDGITAADCRSIFFDWVCGVNEIDNLNQLVLALHQHFAPVNPSHPMTCVLAEGLLPSTNPKKNRRSRRRS